MLKTFSTQIVTDLDAHAPLIALLDATGVSALISEQEDGDSFVNYFVEFNSSQTKDGAKDYRVVIESWSDTYDKSISIADEIVNALIASVNKYDYLSAKSEPVVHSGEVSIVTKQIFNIKQ